MYTFSFCFCLFMIEKIVIHYHNCMGNIEEGYDSLHTRYCNMWASRPVLETKTLRFMVCLSSSLSLPLYLSACTSIPPFTRVTLYLHYHILLFSLSTCHSLLFSKFPTPFVNIFFFLFFFAFGVILPFIPNLLCLFRHLYHLLQISSLPLKYEMTKLPYEEDRSDTMEGQLLNPSMVWYSCVRERRILTLGTCSMAWPLKELSTQWTQPKGYYNATFS